MPRRTRLALRMAALAVGFMAFAGSAQAMTVEKVVSPGGIEAWLVEDHSQKVLSLDLAFNGGAAEDPTDRAGLSELVAISLNEGAGDLDSGAFQGRLADLSSSLFFSAKQDYLEGELQTITPSRDAAFDLLRQALASPRFDAPAVERMRDDLTKTIAQRAVQPASEANTIWYRAAFPNHPYGRQVYGTAKTLRAIGLDDLHLYARQRFARRSLHLAVVGDVTPEELKPLLDKTFGALPETPTAMAPVHDVALETSEKPLLLRRVVPQSVVVFGQSGLPISDRDYYAALVVNDVLGGGIFTSRLGTEVREKRGLAYSISTELKDQLHTHLLIGAAGTRNSDIGRTIALIRQEWQRLQASGPTEQELADAKTYLTGSYPLALTSTHAIAGRLLFFQETGLPSDYLDKRNAKIEAVTLEDARRVAHSLLDPHHLTFAVVGAPGDIAPDQTVELSE